MVMPTLDIGIALTYTMATVLLDALDLTTLNKESGNTAATSSIESLEKAVKAKLAQVEAEVHTGFTSDSTFLTQSQGSIKRYGELRSCIQEVIQHQGKMSGKKCLKVSSRFLDSGSRS